MLDRGPRDTRPFGTRRPEGRPDAWTPAITPESADRDGPRPPGPLAWAVRTAALAGFAALFATQYLAHLSGPGEGSAVRVARGPTVLADPETTGSIGRSASDAARATRLDPCAAQAAARPRP